ncbi:MAG: hypothetical protein N3A58_05110 [Spirochaetes bacterium]|nr:hypothetical protein [Spirochaetota bacterium]
MSYLNKLRINSIIFDLNYPFIEFEWEKFFNCIEDLSKVKKETIVEYLFSDSYYHFLIGRYNFDNFFLQSLNYISFGLNEKYFKKRDQIINCYIDILKINENYMDSLVEFLNSFGKLEIIYFLGNFDNLHKEKIDKYLQEKVYKNFYKNNIKLLTSSDFKISKADPQFWYYLNEKIRLDNLTPDKIIAFEGDIDALEECKNFGFISFFLVRNKNVFSFLKKIKSFIDNNFIFN